jgi:hypothetical protein
VPEKVLGTGNYEFEVQLEATPAEKKSTVNK